MDTFQGYKRNQNKVGIRNYILIISAVSCINTVSSKIALKTDSIELNHDKGCLESEESHARTILGIASAGKNPNVAGVLVVELGCEFTDSEKLMKAIESSGKPVEFLSVQEEGGSPHAIKKGITLINKIKEETRVVKKEKVPVDKLIVGVQCGGSDWTTPISGNTAIGKMTDLVIQNGGTVLMSEVAGFPGSEGVVANNASTYEKGLEIYNMVDDIREEFLKEHGTTIESINPTPGNKDGGLTTLVEKSMGNVKKMGDSEIQGIITLEDEIPYPGLWIVDARVEGPDQFNTSGFAMLGAHTTVFSTGRGTPIGNAVMPLIKITGNPETYKKLDSILDFNAGTILEGESIDKVGKELYELLLDVANGKLTKSEINENFEFVIPREHRADINEKASSSTC